MAWPATSTSPISPMLSIAGVAATFHNKNFASAALQAVLSVISQAPATATPAATGVQLHSASSMPTGMAGRLDKSRSAAGADDLTRLSPNLKTNMHRITPCHAQRTAMSHVPQAANQDHKSLLKQQRRAPSLPRDGAQAPCPLLQAHMRSTSHSSEGKARQRFVDAKDRQLGC